MKRIDQTETRQRLHHFMEFTGLKRAWVAEKCDIPYNAFCDFYNDKRSIPKIRERQLVEFMNQYCKANERWIAYKLH